MPVQRILFIACVAATLQAQTNPVSFDKEVKPVLEARCVKCHGPKMQLGKLDLRTRESALAGGEHGPAFLVGDAEKSRLYRHVSGLEKPLMPMDGKLAAAEIDILKRWIAEGAPWEGTLAEIVRKKEPDPEDRTIQPDARKYWAFQLPAVHDPPKNGSPEWDAHPIDAFLYRTMKAKGLEPAPLAGKTTLVRRAYLDLIGLPPTPAQVEAFVNDVRPGAWERLIEQLLASPHYGERWGRHWMDVARYADSNGYEHDFDRPNAWRYRDYVIASFNKDTPFDLFLKEQLAGDEMDDVTNERLIATGFLRNYAKVGFREKDNPQFRYDYLDDMIATLGRGVLGLTVQCARCHDHKFDPIPQRDYYALQSSLWGYVEVEHPLVPKAEADAYAAKVAEVESTIKPLRAAVRDLDEPYAKQVRERKYRTWPQNIQEAVFTPEEKRTPGQVLLANQIIRTTGVSSAEVDRLMPAAELARKKELLAKIAEAERQRPAPIPVAMGITDGDYRFTPDGAGDEPAPGKGVKQEVTAGSFLCDGTKPYTAPPAYFLHHGDQGSRGKVMEPGFVQVASYSQLPTAMPPAHHRTSGRRLALANWLTSRDNPLTARVMANRIWHHHFGRGIVTTLDNFGKTGERPTHPELLDWLALKFMDNSWSIKSMHRLLMTSRAYRMTSGFSSAANERLDADNLFWWRFRAQRLEAEIVRDSILHASGALNLDMAGPAVFPPLPEETLKSMDKGIWKRQAEGPETWRRSVYVYRKRGLPFPFFEVFDLPDQNLTCGRRNVSTVPTQALTLLHNDFVISQSARMADRVASEAGASKEAQVDRAYRLALGRAPSGAELATGVEFLKDQPLQGLTHVLLNLNEFVYLR